MARKGDWIVGLGSANSPIGDISDRIVYAMKVTNKLTLEQYDHLCETDYPKKRPNWHHKSFKSRVGDCIYDYSNGKPPKMREGVHDERNRKKDLSGKYALLSDHFYYFGDKPIQLPERLHSIIHSTQGHKSNANQPYAIAFVDWIESLGKQPNKIYGDPQLRSEFTLCEDITSKCAAQDLEDNDLPEIKLTKKIGMH